MNPENYNFNQTPLQAFMPPVLPPVQDNTSSEPATESLMSAAEPVNSTAFAAPVAEPAATNTTEFATPVAEPIVTPAAEDIALPVDTDVRRLKTRNKVLAALVVLFALATATLGVLYALKPATVLPGANNCEVFQSTDPSLDASSLR